MDRADWVISSKITSKGQVTLPKVMRTKLWIREGGLIGFTVEKNHRVYIEKMNQGVLCPICEGDSLKKDANKVECVICNNQGLLYQSNEGEWLLLAAEVAQLFTLQLNLYKTNQKY